MGFGLALFSTGTLIYFTHHMATLIAAPEVLETVAVELDAAVDNLYPVYKAAVDACLPPLDDDAVGVIRAATGGYVQAVDLKALVKLAGDHDVIIESVVGYGEYVLSGAVIARVHGVALNDDAAEQAGAHSVFGDNRLTGHDLLFATNRVAEPCRGYSRGGRARAQRR